MRTCGTNVAEVSASVKGGERWPRRIGRAWLAGSRPRALGPACGAQSGLPTQAARCPVDAPIQFCQIRRGRPGWQTDRSILSERRQVAPLPDREPPPCSQPQRVVTESPSHVTDDPAVRERGRDREAAQESSSGPGTAVEWSQARNAAAWAALSSTSPRVDAMRRREQRLDQQFVAGHEVSSSGPPAD
jgi:hypothetical protein